MTQDPLPPHARQSPATWALARADYEAGASLRIVAERHRLNIRTVSRHAAAEGWQAPHVPAAEAYGRALGERDYDPSAFHELMSATLVAHQDDEALLLRPDTISLCRFAFRRAAECASVSGPTEALSWIRLAEATGRLRRNVEVDVRPLSQADYRRVAALAREEADAVREAMAAAPPDDGAGPTPEVSETVP